MNYELKNNVPVIRFPEFIGEWEVKMLGDVCERNKDKYNPSNNKIIYKCIELECLEQQTGRLIKTFNSQELKSIKNKFYKGEVLFGKLRPYLKKFYLAGFSGVCTSEIWVLRGINTSNTFLYFLIQTELFNYQVNMTTGSKMPRADWNIVQASIFSFPPLPEQKKIAHFFSTIDQKINQLQEKKKALEAYKKGLMQQIFSQKLRFKDDNGHDFPEWEVKKLGEVGKIIGGGTPESNIPHYWEGKIPWISSSDIFENKVHNISITRYISEEALRKSATKLIPQNSILMVSRVGLGKFAVSKEILCTSQDFSNFLPFNANSVFLAYYFSQKKQRFLSLAQGTSIKGITGKDICNLKFLIPDSIQEQTKIANFLSKIDEKIANVNEQIEKTKEWKKGLLQKMFCN